MSRFLVQPRSYIYSSNSDAVVIESTTPDTRLVLLNTGQNQRSVISASNDQLMFMKGSNAIAIMGVTSAGQSQLLVPGILTPNVLDAHGLTASASTGLVVSETMQFRSTGKAGPVFATLTDDQQQWFWGGASGSNVALTLSPAAPTGTFAVQTNSNQNVLAVTTCNLGGQVTVTGTLAVDGTTVVLPGDGRNAISLGDGLADTAYSRKMMVMRDFNPDSDHQYVGAGVESNNQYIFQVPTTNGAFSFMAAEDALSSQEWLRLSSAGVFADTITTASLFPATIAPMSGSNAINVTGSWLSNIGHITVNTSIDAPLITSSTGAINLSSAAVLVNQLGSSSANIEVVSDMVFAASNRLYLNQLAAASNAPIDCGRAMLSNLRLEVESIQVVGASPMAPIQVAPISLTVAAAAGQQSFRMQTNGFYTAAASNAHVHLNGRKLAYANSNVKDYDIIHQFDAASSNTYFTVALTVPSYIGDVIDIVLWPEAGPSQIGQEQLFQAFTFNGYPWTTLPYSSDIAYDTGGFVGIGTTPLAPLHVQGLVLAAAFAGDGSGLANVQASNLAGRITTAALPSEIVVTGNLVTTWGAVGVGVDHPVAAVDVLGDIHATGQGVFGGRPLVESAFTDATVASNITGTLDSGVLPPTSVVAGTYGSSNEIPVFSVDATGRITFSSNQPIVTTGWKGSDKGTYYDTGNVGIGTAAGANSLVVEGGVYIANVTGSGLPLLSVKSSTAAPSLVIDADGAVTLPAATIGTLVSSNVTFYSGSNIVFTIADNGVVMSNLVVDHTSFNSLYVGASATVSGLLTSCSATVSGLLTSSSATVSGLLTSSNATVSGLLTSSNATVSGLLTSSNATVSGLLTSSTAAVTSNMLIGGLLTVSGSSSFDGDMTSSNITVSGMTVCQSNVQVNGIIFAHGGVQSVSDSNVKRDLIPIEDALDKISKLSGYSYTRTDTHQKEYGLVAQEVQAVLPDLVRQCDVSKLLSISYGNMAGVFVEALKALVAKLDQVTQELEAVKGCVRQHSA